MINHNFVKNFWESPEIQGINRLPMRSHLLPYSSIEEAANECALGIENLSDKESVSTIATKSNYVKLLDGSWKFSLIENPTKDSEEKYKNWTIPNYDCKDWDKIKVPGTWTLQGYDFPHYTNVQMPFDILPPNVPEKNPTGLYRLDTTIPASWNNRRVVLHIGSAESVVQVFINGVEVGISKDTRLPCEFEISPYLDFSVKGEIPVSIALKVIRYSDASFVEDQDQWWFGGIHRSVYLYTTANTFIQDVETLSYIDDYKKIEKSSKPLLQADSTIPLKVTMGMSEPDKIVTRRTNQENDNFFRTIKYQVFELENSLENPKLGKMVAEGDEKVPFNYRVNQNIFEKDIKIKKAKLWSHENPNLYVVTVALFDEGKLLEATAFTTGFKSVEVKNRELLINKKMVYIKGVNRHEHHEKFGKTIPLSNMLKDLELLKNHNFNAVRTCHYPDDERWYQLCDRYGILLLDEANIENHAYYDCMCRSDIWTQSYLERIMRMVRRDKNHVSIFGWSLGNESGDGQNQTAAVAWLRRVDTTRLVHYEGFIRPEKTQGDPTLETLARGKDLTDLIAPMYPPIDLITKYADTVEDSRPLIMCEYSHAMGNANGSLSDYWEAIYSHKGLQGGFIWDWIDQGIYAETPKSTERGKPQGGGFWKYGGDFGDAPSDYDFCLNGITFPDQSPKPVLAECKKLFSPILVKGVLPLQGKFEIHNRFDYSSLKGIQINWTLLKNGEIAKSGKINCPDILPDEKAEIFLPISDYIKNLDGKELVLKLSFSKGKQEKFDPAVISEEEFILQEELCFSEYEKSQSDKNPQCDFARELQEKTISEVFTPTIFRGIIENECIKRQIPMFSFDNLPEWILIRPIVSWLKNDLPNAKIISPTENCFEIWSGDDGKESNKLATCEIKKETVQIGKSKTGSKINVIFNLHDSMKEFPRAGIQMEIPKNFDSVTWYGQGPHECYNDRQFSAHRGLYSLKADELEVPYIVPQENGTRIGTKYLCLKSTSGEEIHIQSRKDFGWNYSKYSTKDLWKCEHRNELVDLTQGENGYYVLILDLAHRGVGTGVCGPDTLEQYRVRPGTYETEFYIW